jgi:hypothetical protein
MPCECLSLKDLVVVDMAHPDVMAAFEEVANRGQPYWWLEASRCASCRTPWLVGHEERQNDILVLRRLTEIELRRIVDDGAWPSDFDQYEMLLKLGREAGHVVRWLDPIHDSDLLTTITDLARQRPGIRVSELAELLNIDFDIAATIAEQAAASSRVWINRDDEPWK